MIRNPILEEMLARERATERLREADRRRLIARVSQDRLTLTRRAARPIGHMLLRLGAWLLCYGLVETREVAPVSVGAACE
jgi:hypothetical protein